ncbi:inositol monophosphatase family protein [Spiribacter sp. 1M153]|uniref:inositol monophosphatase family protein n=1 Tax=Spiribacter roseus TaxID=1855875 RepID=UPI00349F3038
MSPEYQLALQAATAAVDLLRRDFLEDAQVTDDRDKDIKTQADVAAQALIISHLEPTGIPVLAEEADVKEVDLAHPVWLVDPLDGTLNFTRGFAMAAISIALWDKGQPVFGVVQDIFNGQGYTGVVDEGAWCDDQPLGVSTVDAVDQAILATGFPSGRQYDTESLFGFVQSVQSYKKVRMLGSAALMLTQVAAGHFDVYEEEDIYIWDVAAGLALVRAAGGQFTMAPGSGPFKYRVKATNGRL